LSERVVIVEYDHEWPAMFAREAASIRAALGDRALQIEHVGSTSVPGLAAKPVIDILLVVSDSADEAAYVPDLEARGYSVRIREPEWYEHRLFNGDAAPLNLHVLSAGCEEIDRMIVFRDWLRTNAADRDLYERTKRQLAESAWSSVQDYADAKTAVVGEIMTRARAGK
jgi:GrpB-like predicted nucleotidyltransferase (UPF0157 family)